MQNNLRVLKTFATEFEAQLVRTKLEREGIESMVQGDELSNMLPSLDYSSGVSLYVEPEDYDRAYALVNTTDDDLEEGEDISSSGPAIDPTVRM